MALALGVYVLRTLDRLLLGGDAEPGARVAVTIPANSSSSDIANILDDAGVVGSSTRFQAELLLHGDGDSFRPGSYRLRKNEDYDLLVAALERGPAPPPLARLTIPEGLTLREMASDYAPDIGISEKAYRAAVRASKPPSGYRATGNQRLGMEGFLFPATYELRRPAKAKQLVQAQVMAFKRAASQVDFRRAAKRNLTRYDVLIIASMIEREAADAGDRAKIAAVIYNRLRQRMPLGIDATLQYANGSWRPLKAADLTRPGPYNTRLRQGLPPTPIANPGLASLKAAAAPAKTTALYYVAIPGDERRRHFFTDSYEEFLQYQEDHPA